MAKLGIDVENITDRDIVSLLKLIDQMRHNTEVIIFKYSKPNNQIIHAEEVRTSGLPYSNIIFVDFKDYINRTYDMYDAVLEHGEDIILFTKNYDLALLLKTQIGEVYLYG
jgi:hypothetical protein